MMDEDRSLTELADGALDDVDAATLAAVRDLFEATDDLPDDLVGRVHFALALDELYDEVARMTRVPMDALAVRTEQLEGTRTESLTFSADRLTAMVTVSRIGPHEVRLDGWLAPPEACRVRLRRQDGTDQDTTSDAQGRFSFGSLTEGYVQLSFHPVRDSDEDGDDDAENAVVTPLFQL